MARWLLLGILFATAMAVADDTVPPVSAAPTEWRTVVLHAGTDLVGFHKALTHLNSPDREDVSILSRLQADGGDPLADVFDGWRFVEDETREHRLGLIRLVDRSTPAHYAVELHVYCDTEANCGASRARALTYAAPKPKSAAPASTVMQEWWMLVMNEACEPGPIAMPTPTPPLRRDKDIPETGIVRIGIVSNPCGEIRDAWIVQSSGNDTFDRSTLRTMRSWRIPQKSVRGIVPIEYHLPQ